MNDEFKIEKIFKNAFIAEKLTKKFQPNKLQGKNVHKN